MFRLSEDKFKDDKELYDLATYCLTETIKGNLKDYFYKDYTTVSNDDLYMKVDVESIIDMFTEHILDDMNELGIIPEVFIAKKVAQMMLQLESEEYITFDIFNEYILYLMMKQRAELDMDVSIEEVEDKIPKLRELITKYAKKNLDYLNNKEKKKYIKNTILLLTDFNSLLYVDDEEFSFAFWDWDFSFFNDWGFIDVLKQSLNGVLSVRGYDKEYIKEMFTSVAEEFPMKVRYM